MGLCLCKTIFLPISHPNPETQKTQHHQIEYKNSYHLVTLAKALQSLYCSSGLAPASCSAQLDLGNVSSHSTVRFGFYSQL